MLLVHSTHHDEDWLTEFRAQWVHLIPPAEQQKRVA